MLYNFDWLKEDAIFPPASEIERLSKYRDSRELFEGNTEAVLSSYQTRINTIMNKLELTTHFKVDVNYHRLLSVKTADLVCGEMPDIKISNADDDNLKQILRANKFKKKLYEAVIDVSRLGESIARVMYSADKKCNTFVFMSPDKWFPIVNVEDLSDVKAHCLAWIENDPNSTKYNPKYYLRVQIHTKGQFENRTYSVKKGIRNDPQMISSNISGMPQAQRQITMDTYVIGKEISECRKIEKTGLNDFAIVPFQNLTVPDSVYGYNDYEPISSLVAELEVRLMLENAVLDKHTAPTIFADDKNFVINNATGRLEFSTGKGVIVEPNGIVPGYMIWDASLQANHEMISTLKDLLYSITEMGAVINDEAFGASQGYEALMVRLTSARMKARRISDNLTDSLAELIDLVSQKGYEHINKNDISIIWNDGIPDTETQNIDIAIKKLQLFPLKNILMEHFDVSEEDAEAFVEEIELSRANAFGSAFANGVGGG